MKKSAALTLLSYILGSLLAACLYSAAQDAWLYQFFPYDFWNSLGVGLLYNGVGGLGLGLLTSPVYGLLLHVFARHLPHSISYYLFLGGLIGAINYWLLIFAWMFGVLNTNTILNYLMGSFASCATVLLLTTIISFFLGRLILRPKF
jgi:hypothetical protein